MATIQISKNTNVVDILSDCSLSELAVNVTMSAFSNRDHPIGIIDLIDGVRKNNSQFKFTDDKYFYKTIASLIAKRYMEYIQ